MSADDYNSRPASLVLGWQEWLSLPELGLAALKAKIDTGARTSSLHAFDIRPFDQGGHSMIRFSVHPVRGREDIVVACVARVVDRREVASSNGDRELRYVIETPVSIGGRQWPIEITLTDRSTMSYRMLVGRSAIKDDIIVDPTASFRQPRLSNRAYRRSPRERPAKAPLSIALIVDRDEQPTDRLITRVGLRRGHCIERLDLRQVALSLAGNRANLVVAGRPVPPFDAYIARFGRAAARRGVLVARHLEFVGSISPNPVEALARCFDRFATAQHLIAHGVAVSAAAMDDPATIVPNEPQASAPGVRCLIVAGRCVGVLDADGSVRPEFSAAGASECARSAAKALGLGLAEVVVADEPDGLVVVGVSAQPRIAQFPNAGATAATTLYLLIEARTRASAAACLHPEGDAT